jgi:hypothetical protein
MYHMKAHPKCGILAHSKFMETHFGPNEPSAFCVAEMCTLQTDKPTESSCPIGPWTGKI